MGSAEEEIYITMVVVKRPAQGIRSEADPSRWVQTMLDSLAVQMPADASCLSVTGSRGPGTPTERGRPGPSRQLQAALSPGRRTRPARTDTRASTWILLGLSLLCFIGSACSFYFLRK